MSFFKTLFNSCTSQKNWDHDACQTFENWPKLPGYIKRRIILEMDQATRSNLADCSRSDYRIVKETERDYLYSSSDEDESTTRSSDDGWNSFEDWIRLPEEIKHVVISKMDYFTRLQFSRCSKPDHKRVNDVKTEMFSMRIKQRRDSTKSQDYVEVSILFDAEAEDCVHLRFVEKREELGKCYLSVGSGDYSDLEWEQRSEMHDEENYEIVAFKTITKFLKMCDFKVNRLIIQMENPVLQYIFEKTIKSVDEFQINSNPHNPQYILWWLGKVGNLKSLGVITFNGSKESISEIATKLSTKTCPNIYFSYLADRYFSEEQFLNSNATDIHLSIDERSLLTSRTLNEFIKRWISGKSVVGFMQLWVYANGTVEFDRNELLEGIKASEWDYTFKRKREAFCDLFSQFFKGDDVLQINNKKGDMTATLQFDKEKLLFMVTGELKDGRMCYRFPKVFMPF